MKKLLILPLLSLLFLTAKADEIQFEETSWEAVKAKAAELNKPIFVDVYTEWCGPCKWMAKNIFTDDKVAAYFNEHFVNVSIDAEKGEGIAFAKQYGVKFYPTLFFMDANGEVLHQKAGSMQAPQFIELARKAMNPTYQIGSKIKKWEQGARGIEFVRSYALSRMDAGLDASEQVNYYFDHTPESDWSGKQSWELIMRYCYTWTPMMDMPVFDHVLSHKEDFPKEEFDRFVDIQIGLSLGNAATKDKESFQKARAKVDSYDLEDEAKILAGADLSFLRTHGSPGEYYPALDTYQKTYNWDNPMPLNNNAYTTYEKVSDNKKYMKMALKWVNRSLELDYNSASLDTKASVLYALGKNKKALEIAELSVAKGLEEGETKENLQPTYDLIKKLKGNN